MLGINVTINAASELSSKGQEASWVHAAGSSEMEEEAIDSTDAEQADLGSEELTRLRTTAAPSGRSSWDSLALQALGFQDFAARELEDHKDHTGEGNWRKKEGLENSGDQLDERINLKTNNPEEQVKNKKRGNGTEVNLFLTCGVGTEVNRPK